MPDSCMSLIRSSASFCTSGGRTGPSLAAAAAPPPGLGAPFTETGAASAAEEQAAGREPLLRLGGRDGPRDAVGREGAGCGGAASGLRGMYQMP